MSLPRATSASVDNMFLIDSGDAKLAFVLSDTAYDAAQGNEPFEEPMDARRWSPSTTTSPRW